MDELKNDLMTVIVGQKLPPEAEAHGIIAIVVDETKITLFFDDGKICAFNTTKVPEERG